MRTFDPAKLVAADRGRAGHDRRCSSRRCCSSCSQTRDPDEHRPSRAALDHERRVAGPGDADRGLGRAGHRDPPGLRAHRELRPGVPDQPGRGAHAGRVDGQGVLLHPGARGRRRTATTSPPGTPGELICQRPRTSWSATGTVRRPRPRRSSTAGCTPATSPSVDKDGYVYIQRPHQGHDHQRRRERLPGRDRERPPRPPGDRRRRRHRPGLASAGARRRWPSWCARTTPLTEADILAYTEGKLARYKRPSAVTFVDEIPRNPSGKALKRILREQFPDPAPDDACRPARGRSATEVRVAGSTSERARRAGSRRSPGGRRGRRRRRRDGQPEAGAAAVAGRGPRRGGRSAARRRRAGRRGCPARRRRRATATSPPVGLDVDAHRRRGVPGGVGDEVVDGPPRRRPASPTTGSTSSPTRRRRPAPGGVRAPTSRDDVGDRERRASANARSSPRASSRRSSTRPCSRSSSPSSTSLVASQSASATAPGDLQLGAHHGHRRAQLVRGVGRPAGGSSSMAVSSRPSIPFIVARQLGDLVAGRRHRHPLVQRVATRSRRPATSRRAPAAAPGRPAARPARRRARRGPARHHSRRRVAAIVSRTASSGDAVASVTPPTDSVETSNVAGSPRDAEQLGAGHRHRPGVHDLLAPSSSVGDRRCVRSGRRRSAPAPRRAGPAGAGSSNAAPPLGGDGDGVGRDAPG